MKTIEYLQKHVKPDDIYHHCAILQEGFLLMCQRIAVFSKENPNSGILKDIEIIKGLSVAGILLEEMMEDRQPITLMTKD